MEQYQALCACIPFNTNFKSVQYIMQTEGYVTSTIARTITSTLIFPFDYWKTIQQGTFGQNKESGFKMEMQPKAGYGALLQRDIIFSMIYWILTENTRSFLKYLRNSNEENTYNGKVTLVISNAIAGSLSGINVTNKHQLKF